MDRALLCDSARMVSNPSNRSANGFTLIEVLIAVALLISISVGIAQLFAIGLASGRASRERTVAAILAASKLEQLRAQAWSYERGSLVPRTDRTTNSSVDPHTDDGPGLQDSPPVTLDGNVAPYVDYLDARARWAGNGAKPPGNAVFVRRWAVRRLPDDPDRSLALVVFVTTVTRAARRSSPTAWTGEDALLTTILTRKAQ
jgi:prepilin-type N-terminal cleavage/methylation domain-containing protein